MYLPVTPLQAGFVCVIDGAVLLSGVCLGIRRSYLDVFPLSGRCWWITLLYPACLGRHVAMATEEMCVCVRWWWWWWQNALHWQILSTCFQIDLHRSDNSVSWKFALMSRASAPFENHFQAYKFSHHNNWSCYYGIELCYKNIKPLIIVSAKRKCKYSKTLDNTIVWSKYMFQTDSSR